MALVCEFTNSTGTLRFRYDNGEITIAYSSHDSDRVDTFCITYEEARQIMPILIMPRVGLTQDLSEGDMRWR